MCLKDNERIEIETEIKRFSGDRNNFTVNPIRKVIVEDDQHVWNTTDRLSNYEVSSRIVSKERADARALEIARLNGRFSG
jgi:hypothetical protein